MDIKVIATSNDTIPTSRLTATHSAKFNEKNHRNGDITCETNVHEGLRVLYKVTRRACG